MQPFRPPLPTSFIPGTKIGPCVKENVPNVVNYSCLARRRRCVLSVLQTASFPRMLLECVINLTNDISTSPIKLHGMRISHLWNTPRQVGCAAVLCRVAVCGFVCISTRPLPHYCATLCGENRHRVLSRQRWDILFLCETEKAYAFNLEARVLGTISPEGFANHLSCQALRASCVGAHHALKLET